MKNIVNIILTSLFVLTILVGTSLKGSAEQVVYTCNKCDGARSCYPCNGTGSYLGHSCAICTGTGVCYYCSGTGRL